jgi:hypothetical protein
MTYLPVKRLGARGAKLLESRVYHRKAGLRDEEETRNEEG